MSTLMHVYDFLLIQLQFYNYFVIAMYFHYFLILVLQFHNYFVILMINLLSVNRHQLFFLILMFIYRFIHLI
jgi:hypothetical protein